MSDEATEDHEAPAAWQSPYRIDIATWNALVDELAPRSRVAPATGPRRTARVSGTREELPADACSAWAIALSRAGRLGRHLGEGRFAILCINDHQHSDPDGGAENAGGSCVLLPAFEGSVMGLPKCSHAHCAHLTLDDWARAVGVDVFAEALTEAKGWRFAPFKTRNGDGYLITPDGVFWALRKPMDLRPKGDGKAVTEDAEVREIASDGPFKYVAGGQLANFRAQILNNIVEDYGTSQRVLFELSTEVSRREKTLRVLAEEFPGLGWIKHLGGEATLSPGRDAKDHVRAAIQLTSIPIPWRRVFANTGWTMIGDDPVYLHAGGGIGAAGALPGVEVLRGHEVVQGMKLPAPLGGTDLLRGLLSSVELFTSQPKVTVPLFGAVWRAAMGGAKAALYIAGSPKSGKTVRAVLAQSYFGAGWNEKNFPASWKHSTAGSIIGLMATAGDCLFLVDDFLISGNATDDAKLNEKVDTVVRAVFGGAGARRLTSDGRVQESAGAPRSLLVITGEVLPRGSSLRSRFLVLTNQKDVRLHLDRHKAEARQGLYAGTMAAFVQWFAARKATFDAEGADELAKIAERLSDSIDDRRSAELLAHVALGVRWFIAFAGENGVPKDSLEDLRALAWKTLQELATDQQTSQSSADPAVQFQEALSSAVHGALGHVSMTDGSPPPEAHLWGWLPQAQHHASRREDDDEGGGEVETIYRPSGPRIGVIDGGEVWIFPDAALGAARQASERAGSPLAIGREDLPRRLHERGMLARDERKSRGTWYCRKRIAGKVLGGFLVLREEVLLGADQTQTQAPRVGAEGGLCQVPVGAPDTATLQ